MRIGSLIRSFGGEKRTVFGGLLVVLSLLGVVSAGQTFLPQTSAVPPTGLYFDHVVIIVMENEGIWDICHQSPPPCQPVVAPYMAALANNYTIASQYLGLINTSQPNYVALISGSLQGCTSSGCPVVMAPNLVDRFEAVGLTWKGYFENQITQGCDKNSPEPYTSIHNPFLPFQDITNNIARCNKIVRANPTSCTVIDCVLINDLNNASSPAPSFMWLTPNDCNDMRATSGCANGCTSGGSSTCITQGDLYLKNLVSKILASNTFKNERSALFITFDEGDGYCPLNGQNIDCLYAMWAGPVAKNGFSSTKQYSHYSFPKTIEVNWGLASFTSNDANALAMTEFFKTTTQPPDFSISNNPSSISFQSGSSATSTVNLASLNGFSGTVSLSASVSPGSGLAASLNPTTLTLSSGGSGSSILSMSSSTPGSYTVTVTGMSGSLTRSATVLVSVGSPPDFSISSSPASVTVQPGVQGTTSIVLSSLNSFSGTVSLAASASSAALAASVNPASVSLSSGGSASSTLTVSSSTPGSYSVLVTGTSGTLSHSTTVAVTVTGSPDFSISSNPSTVSFQSGSSGTSAVSLISLNGFSGTVTLSTAVVPSSGLTASLNPSTVTLSSGGSGSSTLTVVSSTPGNYTVSITGTSGSISHITQVTVLVAQPAVPDFSIDVSPGNGNFVVGSSRTSTVSLASIGGFTGTVTLSSTVSSNLTESLNPTSLVLPSGGSATSTLTLTSSTVGTYNVTVTGSSGSIAHTFSFIVKVQDFSLTADTGAITIVRVGSGNVGITVASINGFAGTVSFSATSSPSGPKLSFSLSSVVLGPDGSGSSTLTIRAIGKTAPGTYTITITATSQGLTRTTTILLTVS